MLSALRRRVAVTLSPAAVSVPVTQIAGWYGGAAYQATPFIHPTNVLLMRKFKGRKGPRHREPKEGDWVCQCGETNYKSKRECYKCGAPAPPLPPGVRRPSLPGEDPHDWACPCGQMNFRQNVNCYKCNQPKPMSPSAVGSEVTMWNCPKCKNTNRSTRRNCFKCFSLAPGAKPLIPLSIKTPADPSSQ